MVILRWRDERIRSGRGTVSVRLLPRALLLLLSLGVTFLVWGDLIPKVPVDSQAKIFTHVLSFDRSLANARKGEIVIGVVYQPMFRISSITARELTRQVTGTSINDVPIRTMLIEIEDDTSVLDRVLVQERVDAVFIAPLRAVKIEDLARIAASRRVRTFASLEGYVARGLAVGVRLERGYPKLLINLDAARSQGMDLDSRVLALARVTREDR